MKLIEYSNYQIKVADEAFLVKPIRTLFNKDKSKTKDNFWSQMSYMYFLVDPRSSYMYIVDEKERAKEIIKQEGLPEDFTPSKELLEAMDIYKKTTQTSSSLLLEDTRLAIDKLRQFLKDVDLNKCDDKGKPVYPVNTITSTIKQIPDLAKSLVEAEKAVNKEIIEEGRARGGNNKRLFDDGINL